jgi:hypothetical protein
MQRAGRTTVPASSLDASSFDRGAARERLPSVTRGTDVGKGLLHARGKPALRPRGQRYCAGKPALHARGNQRHTAQGGFDSLSGNSALHARGDRGNQRAWTFLRAASARSGSCASCARGRDRSCGSTSRATPSAAGFPRRRSRAPGRASTGRCEPARSGTRRSR